MRSTTALAWFIASVAIFAANGCNKAERNYPTISARSPDGGRVNVHGTYNRCPQALFVASPDHGPVGQRISLTALASDMDGDVLTYSWTATSGTIENPSAAATTFTCTTNGAVTLTLTVTDSSCPSATSGVLLCQPGDGGASDGRDGGAGGQSGNGGQAGSGGSMAGAGGAGAATGVAGATGFAGANGVAGATGAAGAAGAGTAGAGVAGTTGGSSSGGSGGAGVCVETAPPAEIVLACMACLDMFSQPNEGCCRIDDTVGRQLCQAVSACMRTGNCNAAGDTMTCFCGTNSGTCDTPGQPNGPCVAEVTAAAGRNVMTRTTDTPNASQVLTRFGDTTYALGRASSIHSYAGSFCPADCAVGM